MCQTCKGKGFIIYTKKVGDQKLEYIARCDCEKGMKDWPHIPPYKAVLHGH